MKRFGMVQRILNSLGVGILWGLAGSLIGLSGGYVLDQPWLTYVPISITVAAVVGMIYGWISPPPLKRASKLADKAQWGLIRCGWCEGTGREPRRSRQACSVCWGRRRILTEQPPQPCPNCRGRGRLRLGRRCRVCYGAGVANYVLFERNALKRAAPKQPRRWGKFWFGGA